MVRHVRQNRFSRTTHQPKQHSSPIKPFSLLRDPPVGSMLIGRRVQLYLIPTQPPTHLLPTCSPTRPLRGLAFWGYRVYSSDNSINHKSSDPWTQSCDLRPDGCFKPRLRLLPLLPAFWDRISRPMWVLFQISATQITAVLTFPSICLFVPWNKKGIFPVLIDSL